MDLRRQPLRAGLSPALLTAVEETLGQGGQVLLFLNRRGYASRLQCHDCGWVAGCDHCDARLTVHRRRKRLQCHHCGARKPLPVACPACGGTQLLAGGLGTEQTEEFLAAALPRWPLYRVDSDAIDSPAAMETLLAGVGRGEPCILLGTQMLTKGHHFPAVALVGVVDCDALLFAGDFRGEERLAQLLTQVAGRAGRAGRPGRMLLQSHYPDHPLLRAILEQPYNEVATALLARRVAAGLPPAGQIALVRADSPRAGEGERFLAALRRDAAAMLPQGTQLVGPLPSALPRRAGRYRDQLLCLSPDRARGALAAGALVQAGEALRSPRALNWFLEIDPLDTL
ncbi:Helicase PriA essential for oriC/DnaA-independent DNA replication [Pseudohaliea rubra DSM 19751]|uniref:Helicase PriA essential for oriC/DnaA-independent DNA replication n=1 Tax=Pseudohaliea rubra DSM 19751 TaxID=1265313 RepID=A0A095VNY0_9GAMM|nr:Helicase PriA essential for oriC/DnaA-independent DNA replication [Pseudohaliea rubra DSM 19751]